MRRIGEEEMPDGDEAQDSRMGTTPMEGGRLDVEGPPGGPLGGGRGEGGPPAQGGTELNERHLPEERDGLETGARTRDGRTDGQPAESGEVGGRARVPAGGARGEDLDESEYAGRGTVADYGGTFWEAVDE